MKWECFDSNFLLGALGPFVKQISSDLAGEDKEGGLGFGAVPVTGTGPRRWTDSAAFEVRQQTGADSK